MGGLDIRIRVIKVVKGGSRAGMVTLKFTPRAMLEIQ